MWNLFSIHYVDLSTLLIGIEYAISYAQIHRSRRLKLKNLDDINTGPLAYPCIVVISLLKIRFTTMSYYCEHSLCTNHSLNYQKLAKNVNQNA